MRITNARNFHTLAINRIQSSYYSESVIEDCISKASTNGYTLIVTDQTIYDDRKDVKVELVYSIDIPLFNVDNTSTLIGYAR